MTHFTSQFKDNTTTVTAFAKESGKERAKIAAKRIMTTVAKTSYPLEETKTIFIKITCGKIELSIDEIGDINDIIQNNNNSKPNIVMHIAEKNLNESLEIQVLFTKLEEAALDIEAQAYQYLNNCYGS